MRNVGDPKKRSPSAAAADSMCVSCTGAIHTGLGHQLAQARQQPPHDSGSIEVEDLDLHAPILGWDGGGAHPRRRRARTTNAPAEPARTRARPRPEHPDDRDASDECQHRRQAGAADDRQAPTPTRRAGRGHASTAPLDTSASGDVLSVVGEQRAPERDEVADALVRDAISNGAPVAFSVNEPAQRRQAR